METKPSVESKEYKKRHLDQKLCRTKKALERNYFKVLIASTKEDALQKVLGLIPPNSKIGVGGSVTIREIGLIEALTKRRNQVVHHWLPGISLKERLSKMIEAHNSNIYLCSSNAITEDGKLVNIDGVGNRVASMIFGPNKVIVIAGKNKIVKNVDEAFKRLKNVAAPLNAKRHDLKELPCVTTGVCTDCDSPKRICRVITIMERAPNRIRNAIITVVLIAEELGF